jgi:hypothetical protein
VFTLILVFTLDGHRWTVERPVDSMQACMVGAGAQITAEQFIHEHPGAVWDMHWQCKLGPDERGA